MACEVTVKDIQNLIRNRVKDKFDSVKFTKYSDRLAGFIPYDASNPSKNVLYGKVKNLESQLNKEFNASKHGAVVSFRQTVDGVEFNIHPSRKLADEMYMQNIYDEEQSYNSRYSNKQEDESIPNNQQPIGDNYVEFVRYKKAQLEDIEKKKERVKSNLGFKDTSEERAKLKQLDKLEIEIKNQLEILSTNQVDYMFHAILEDLTGLEQALRDFNIHNVQDVKNKIDYYSGFLKELIVEEHEDFDAISGKVARLTSMYDNLIKDKVIQQLEESSLVQELLANENKDKEDADKITIEDLLKANSDISWLDRTFLGLISSTTGDTILPQLLMSEFRKKLYDKQNRVFTLIDKLNSFTKRTGMEDFDWVFSKDKSGNKNGYLVDLYSDKWFAEWKNRNMRLKQYYNSLADANIDTKTTYTNLVNWYKTNTHIIDFTRLSAVKEIFGDQYAEHFTYDDEAIYNYEENLKKQLGPKFEETVEKVINKLQKFEELKETDSEFKERNIASHNIWEFLKSYKQGFPNPIQYTYGEDNKIGKVYFSSFNDLPVLPKSKTTKVVTTDTQRRQEEVDTGFYSEEFQNILSDSNKVEYWSILREMSKYINSTYHLDEQARLSYPKIKTEYAERLLEDIKTIRRTPNAFGKVGSMFHDMLHEYKSFFYEKGQNKNDSGVVSNYADSSRREISELAKTYMLKGMSKKDAYEKATAIVIKEYSTDINTAFKGMLLEAALHDTRLEIAPMAQGILNVYKNIETVDGKERKFGIQRLEGYINKIILNNNEKQRGNTQVGGSDLSRDSLLSKLNDITVKFSNGKVSNHERTKLLTDIEKNIVQELKVIQEQGYQGEFKIQDLDYILQRVYLEDTQDYVYNYNGNIVSKEEFDKNFQEYITKKISSIGLDLNVAGLIDGSLKTIIFKGLGLNPISGIFNRVEGKHSALIMDLTGEYWTPGNIDIANQMMAFSNLKKMLPERLTENMKGKKEQIEIFDLLVNKLGTLQDRKNELQKNVDDSKFNRESLNIFKWAVEHPEFKNQGAIMLAIMMDTKIKDNEGNEHTIIDKETGKFIPFEIEGGILKVKPEFEESFKFESDDVANLVLRLEDAVSHSQGNYNQYDIMLAKKNIWGRAGTLFMTWFPEHFNQRWGLRGDNNYNLFTGKKRKEGRFVAGYKANKANFLAYMLGVLGISYGAIGMSGLIGAGLMGAYVYNKFLKNISNTDTIKRDVNYIKEMIEFLKSITIESLNYPSRIGSSVPGLNKLRIKNNSFQGTNMTQEEIASMQAMARELGIMLTLLSIKLAIAAMTYNDDDDKESEERMRHNFLQNQINRSITSMATFTNPQALASDNSRIAFVSYLTDLWKTLDHTILNPKADKIGQDVLNITPVPRMISKALTGTAPWEDKADYTELPDNNGLTKPLKWTTDLIKDNATDGEFTAKREYKKERDKIVDELKDELIDKYGNNKEVLKMILDRKVKAKIGAKYKGLNYKQALESIENDERMVDPKSKKGSKATRAERNKFKEKLKEEGLSSSEISKIMAEEFRGR